MDRQATPSGWNPRVLMQSHPGDQTWYIPRTYHCWKKLPFLGSAHRCPQRQGGASARRGPPVPHPQPQRGSGPAVPWQTQPAPAGQKFTTSVQMGTSMDETSPNFREPVPVHPAPAGALIQGLQVRPGGWKTSVVVLPRLRPAASTGTHRGVWSGSCCQRNDAPVVNWGASLLACAGGCR